MLVHNYPVWDYLCNHCATANFALNTQKMTTTVKAFRLGRQFSRLKILHLSVKFFALFVERLVAGDFRMRVDVNGDEFSDIHWLPL